MLRKAEAEFPLICIEGPDHSLRSTVGFKGVITGLLREKKTITAQSCWMKNNLDEIKILLIM